MTKALLLPALALTLLAAPALARDCSPKQRADLPPGVIVPPPPGCPGPSSASQARLKAGRPPGAIDLGSGTELRISGRARAEAESRR